MIYVYFDERGVLKELINDVVNSGDFNVNKIAVYWESDSNVYNNNGCGIRYQRADKTFWPTGHDSLPYSSTENLEIPFNRNQDLKFFKYGVTYSFRVFVIPEQVLDNSEDEAAPVICSVYFATNEDQKVMDRFAFNVGPSTLAVAMDQHITLAEWNALVSVLANKQLYIVDKISDVEDNIEHYQIKDMFFAIEQQAFYYITSESQLAQWTFNLVFDETPTDGSNNPVTSNGIYNWVLSQIAALGTLKAHICTGADDTPLGVTWGDDVEGTLEPEEAAPSTLYLVPNDDDNNTYTEYFPIEDAWEVIGSTGIGLPDTPVNNGKYELVVVISGGSKQYKWADPTEWLIDTSGTSFDLSDNRYKLLYDSELYYFMGEGKYGCISSVNTLKTISVDSSTYAWTASSHSVYATSSSQFTIGSVSYTIPAATKVVSVTTSATLVSSTYAELIAHPDWLLDTGDNHGYFKFVGLNTSSTDELIYTRIPISSYAVSANSLVLESFEIGSNNSVSAVTQSSYLKVAANPVGTPASYLDKISIGNVSYYIEDYKKIYRYHITVTITPDDGAGGSLITQKITFDCVSNEDITDSSQIVAKLAARTYACGETAYLSKGFVCLIRSVGFVSSQFVVNFYESMITGGTPPDFNVNPAMQTKTFTIDSISYEKEEL